MAFLPSAIPYMLTSIDRTAFYGDEKFGILCISFSRSIPKLNFYLLGYWIQLAVSFASSDTAMVFLRKFKGKIQFYVSLKVII